MQLGQVSFSENRENRMSSDLEIATEAIYTYTYGMDTGDWKLAVSRFAREIDVDYSAVGAPKARMTPAELQGFLQQLLGKPDLRVHTAVSQVFANPADSSEFIAYYSVRHYRGAGEAARKFALFGWYRYRLHNGLIASLRIDVSATEGNPTVLA